MIKYKLNNDVKTLSLLANKYFEKADYEDAKTRYMELISIFKNADKEMIDDATFKLAMIDYYNEDISGLEIIIIQNQNSDFTKQSLSMLKRFYRTKSDIKGELKIHEQSLELFPNDPTMLNSYAWRMSELELNLDNALNKIDRAIVLSVNDKKRQANILDTKAEVLWKLGNSEEAIKTIEMAIQLNPDNDYFIEQKDKFLSKK